MTNIIEELNKRFGKIMSLPINRGKVHDYLGMTYDYTTVGKLIITMYDYIDGIIKKYRSDIQKWYRISNISL